MEPTGIRKVIAEQSLEGAIIHLAEQIEGKAGEDAHESNSLLYTLQGKIEQLEDRVKQLEDKPSDPAVRAPQPPQEPKAEGGPA